MQRHYDALIVGAGPAGTAAATLLAGRGFSVLLLEKKRLPRPKLCGGLLTRKSMLALERIFGLDVQSAATAGLIDYSSRDYEIIYLDRGQERRLVRGAYEHPFHFVDRAVFDANLAGRATAAGATVLEDAEVIDCAPEAGGVTLRDGRRFEAALCLGADGAHSLLRRQCGFDAAAWRRDLAATIEISVPRATLGPGWEHPKLYVGFVRAGYCWAFPNRDAVLFGVCELLRANTNLSARFREFLAHLGVQDVARRVEIQGRPLPYGNFIARPARGRTLLLGDAAGLVDPLFGEGIYYALRSAELATAAVAEALARKAPETAASAYISALGRDVLPDLVASKRLRRVLYVLKRTFRHLPLAWFLRSGGARLVETVHGLRSFRWFRKSAG